jgi:hypothetical protein
MKLTECSCFALYTAYRCVSRIIGLFTVLGTGAFNFFGFRNIINNIS